LSILSEKPFFTRERMRFLLRKVVLPLFLIYVCLGIVAAIRNMNVKNDEYAAVLLSDHAFWQYDYWASPCAFLGAYIPWTHYFNNRSMKVEWIFRAKGRDFQRVLQDKNCQSLVLVGHGDSDCWQATDGEISVIEATAMMEGVPRKRGEWLQLTCGSQNTFFGKMGDRVMQDGKRVYTYPKPVNTYILIFDALPGFTYLKSLNP